MARKNLYILKKENAKRVEFRDLPSGRFKVYIFDCSDCGKEMPVSNYKRHSGKCTLCSQIKNPEYLYIYKDLKRMAKYPVIISFDDFLNIIKIGKCHYCTTPVLFNPRRTLRNKIRTGSSYQLDRKNNDGGYEKDNLVVCCWNCNKLKSNNFTYEEFVKLGLILKEIWNERNSLVSKLVNETDLKSVGPKVLAGSSPALATNK